MPSRDLLVAAAHHAADFVDSLPDARVAADVRDPETLRAELALALGGEPVDPRVVLDELVAGASPGIVRSPSPRYFGFVIGGSLPAAPPAEKVARGRDHDGGR